MLTNKKEKREEKIKLHQLSQSARVTIWSYAMPIYLFNKNVILYQAKLSMF